MFGICGKETSLEHANTLYSEFLRTGPPKGDSLVHTAIVHMFARCGSLEEAEKLWTTYSPNHEELVEWSNVIIGAFAQYGHADKTVEFFEKMQQQGVKPDSITMVLILNACRFAR